MSLQEAMTTLPLWVQIWVNWLLFVGFVLPLILLIWHQSRLAGIVAALSSVLVGIAGNWIFETYGLVRLLGLPHLVIWVPLLMFLLPQARRADMPGLPRIILWVIIASFAISLVFDVVDVARYAIGERAPLSSIE